MYWQVNVHTDQLTQSWGEWFIKVQVSQGKQKSNHYVIDYTTMITLISRDDFDYDYDFIHVRSNDYD